MGAVFTNKFFYGKDIMSQSFNYRHLFYFWVVAKEGDIARAPPSGWTWRADHQRAGAPAEKVAGREPAAQ